MFSSIFGKRRSSPVEDDTPPIPGPKPDDSFVVVDPLSPGGSLYPNVPSASYPAIPYPQRPAPAVPPRPKIDQSFHYLQGVPFSLCKELQMATSKDSLSSEVGDLLAFLTNRLNLSSYEYNFAVEKSVLKEC